MAFLESFSDDERGLLVSLPYRVGVMISKSDTTGGDHSEEDEIAMLDQTIAKITHGMFESAFVHEVIAETFMHRKDWPAWSNQADTVTADCKKAVVLIQGKLSQRDVDAYKRILMQIGVEVARAYREYEHAAYFLHNVMRWVSLGFNRLFSLFHGEARPSSDILNISYQEDLALNELAKALRGETDDAAESARIITHT